MIRSAARILVIMLVATAAGLGYARYDRNQHDDPAKPEVPLIPGQDDLEKARQEHKRWVEQTGIGLDEFVQHYESGGVVFDARPAILFEDGHLDAPLVLSIPADEAAEGGCDDRIAAFRGCGVVIYCASESCEDAETLWHFLISFGFPAEELHVYHPGMSGIEQSGLPIATGPDPLAPPPDTDSGS